MTRLIDFSYSMMLDTELQIIRLSPYDFYRLMILPNDIIKVYHQESNLGTIEYLYIVESYTEQKEVVELHLKLLFAGKNGNIIRIPFSHSTTQLLYSAPNVLKGLNITDYNDSIVINTGDSIILYDLYSPEVALHKILVRSVKVHGLLRHVEGIQLW